MNFLDHVIEAVENHFKSLDSVDEIAESNANCIGDCDSITVDDDENVSCSEKDR
jgi:hypothetical protein